MSGSTSGTDDIDLLLGTNGIEVTDAWGLIKS